MLLSMRPQLLRILLAATLGLSFAGAARAQVAEFPFFDSFEDATLGSSWTTGGSPDFVVKVTDLYTAADGVQQLELTTMADGSLQSTWANLTVDLSGQQGVRLNFSHRRTMGGSFSQSGVYLSDDGLNFEKVLTLESFTTDEVYADYSLDLDKLASEFGMVFNDHFVVRFLWSGVGSGVSSSGAAYDDVRVVPTNFSLLSAFGSTSATGLGHFGASLASVVDLNGDGVRDLAVGHPGYSLKRGRIEFYSGKSGAYLWSWSKGLFGERMGESLANLGDLDGDGFDELVVGAPSNDLGLVDAGAVYVINSKTGVFLAELHGTAMGEAFGSVLAAVQDLDGDGKAEFLVTAPFADFGFEDAGRVNLFSSKDFASQEAYFGDQDGAQLGASLDWIADLDGDGLAELLIGAPGFDASFAGSDEGRVFVLSTAQSAPLFTFTGPEPGDAFGASVAGLGDLDEDGLADLAAGMPDHLAGAGGMRVLSTATAGVLHEVLGAAEGDHLGATLRRVGQTDGFGGEDLAVGTSGTGAGYVRLIGLPSFADIGFVDVVDEGTGFGVAIDVLGDSNGDGLDDLALGAPLDVRNGQQESGTVRIATLAKGPVVLSVEGVHSTLAGELVLHGTNLLGGTTVRFDGELVPSVSVSVNELRVAVGIDEPGGFHALEVSSKLGTSTFPGGIPRYPALECPAELALGDDLDVRLAGGEPGLFVLAFSNLKYATPAPFENFGWYWGLELNGVWVVAAGLSTPGNTTHNLKLGGTTAASLVGTDFFLQAWTSQSLLGLGGFSNTVQTTLVP
jgi:hypothetical protein